MNNYKNWKLNIDDAIITLALNRPDTLNNLDGETLLELEQIAEYIKSQEKLRCVVIRGKGKHFSTGVDVAIIEQIFEVDKNKFEESLCRMQSCINSFESIEIPIIAQISGFCIGGGIILATCCDFRIVADNAIFAMPEVKRGIGVLMGTERIVRLCGVADVKEMIMLGDKFNSVKALSIGLVNKVVPLKSLDEEVAKLCKKIISLPSDAIKINKQIVDYGWQEKVQRTQENELRLQAINIHAKRK